MSTPSERTWIVEAPVLEDGEGNRFRGEIDSDELAETLVKVGTVLEMVGGICTIGANREEVEPGRWETTSIVARWKSFLPGQRREEPQPEAVEQGDGPGDGETE